MLYKCAIERHHFFASYRKLTSCGIFFASFEVETAGGGGHDVVVLVCEGGGAGDHHGLGHDVVAGAGGGHHVPCHGLTHAGGQVTNTRHARALT